MKFAILPALALLLTLMGGTPQFIGKDPGEPKLLRATLVREDFSSHTVSFDTGLPGAILQGRVVVNRDSDIDFGNYNPGFTVGIQGGENGNIVDFGHWTDIATRYQYSETVGGGQGFNSIRFDDGGLVILDDLSTGSTQPFTEGNDFVAQHPTGNGTAAVEVGHIYMVRTVDVHDDAYELIVKFLVIDADENAASIVWEKLQRAHRRAK